MTERTTPKNQQKTGPASSPSGGMNEASTAQAEQTIKTGTAEGNQPQAAIDVMIGLCRELGLDDLPDLANDLLDGFPDLTDAPPETAYGIIQRFLLGEDPGATGAAGTTGAAGLAGGAGNILPNFQSDIPDPLTILARFHQNDRPPAARPENGTENSTGPETNQASSPDSTKASTMSSRPDTLPRDAVQMDAGSQDATNPMMESWCLTVTREDGDRTGLEGPIQTNQTYGTDMPILRGFVTPTADQSEWAIQLHQKRDFNVAGYGTHSTIAATLTAEDIPADMTEWQLCATDGRTEPTTTMLALAVPEHAPSILGVGVLGCGYDDDPATDCTTAEWSGTPPKGHALHMSQKFGEKSNEQIVNQATIRVVFADQAPIPVTMEYVGDLPSPMVRGTIPINEDRALPFWLQITPPDGDDAITGGASLIVLVCYQQIAGFNVTANLLTGEKSATPTAILSCPDQGYSSACRADSMITIGSERLETCLIGLADMPDDRDLDHYGFAITAKDHASESAHGPARASVRQQAPTAPNETTPKGATNTDADSRKNTPPAKTTKPPQNTAKKSAPTSRKSPPAKKGGTP
ncbi:hypothetical protein LPB41_28500 [Thalassospira sp. MA62]|nr:hypothetical protein [Thalassospira sp. MA62]